MSSQRGSYMIFLPFLWLHCVNCGWVDPDTSLEFRTTVPLTKGDERKYRIVFSDEFETEGRTFTDGEDPKWTALDKNDYTNEALHYYSSENARTVNGVLNITTFFNDNNYKAFNEKTKKKYIDTKHVQSAMLQGWNKFCLTGGIVEFSAKLPGKGNTGGLWPALWLLGNLARATYVGSSNWIWPFSYNTCDPTIRHSQEINACNKITHYGMEGGVGRGSPEIDILEVMGGEPGPLPSTSIERPYFSSSLQISPGVAKDRPKVMEQPKPGYWYQGLEYGNSSTTSINPFFYGVTLFHKTKEYTYQSDAISANTRIDQSYFNRQNIYRVEWEPPESDGSGGYIRWFLNGKFLFGIVGESLKITGTTIPSEPMYLLMNTAVASSWGFPIPCPEGCDCKCFECGNPDCACALPTGYCDNFPAHFEIDYVRVWQAENDPKHSTGCSTENRPTELFIKGHKERYMEEGDKEPIKEIKFGGATCGSHSDCGGSRHGLCSRSGVCVCRKGFAGSKCLAHDGYEDNPYKEDEDSLPVSSIMIPKVLILAFLALAMGLSATLYLTVRFNRKEDASHDRVSQDIAYGQASYGGETKQIDMKQVLYQNPDNFQYLQHSEEDKLRQDEQKVVTYCLIDGRLIDE